MLSLRCILTREVELWRKNWVRLKDIAYETLIRIDKYTRAIQKSTGLLLHKQTASNSYDLRFRTAMHDFGMYENYLESIYFPHLRDLNAHLIFVIRGDSSQNNEGP